MSIPDEKGHDIFKYFTFLINKGIFNVFKYHSISINFVLKMNLDLLQHPYYILIGTLSKLHLHWIEFVSTSSPCIDEMVS